MTTVLPKLFLNIYWHMHQPDYRDTITGEYVLPWTYLHAIKDYTDMAYHVEANPHVKVTFNFVPILLDQLEDYSQQFQTNDIRDPLLAMLVRPNLEYLSTKERCLIVDSCFKSHHEKMLEPFAHYQRLLHIYNALHVEGSTASNYLSGQYMADLLVWYHLAWTGESIRKNNKFVQGLMEKGNQFTLQERLDLFAIIADLITELIPRYKRLQDKGQIEITTTPHYHPILPLLIDFKSTRDAMPFAPLPSCGNYPDGVNRAKMHIKAAQVSHLRRFGVKPLGMWPAEGAVSHAAFSLMADSGIKWAATGQGVLANSLYKSFDRMDLPPKEEYLYTPYRVTNGNNDIVVFFRDDNLSDKIGFEYAKLYASDAVNDFVRTLEGIYKSNKTSSNKVVSVILDGENAWEYYPYNAFYFLSELYAALATSPFVEMKTFSEIVGELAKTKSVELKPLPSIAAGSWVYGSFSTWIGSHDKNHGWDLLCDAKKVYDKVIKSKILSIDESKAAERQLSICEGSDWFWWFGDYNSSVSVDSFDRLYRRNLANLYNLLKQPVPEILSVAISAGGGDPAVGGTMRRGQE